VKLADFGVATRMPDGRLPQQARQDDDVAGIYLLVCVCVCVCVCVHTTFMCVCVCV
jgi:hypothetical protein